LYREEEAPRFELSSETEESSEESYSSSDEEPVTPPPIIKVRPRARKEGKDIEC